MHFFQAELNLHHCKPVSPGRPQYVGVENHEMISFSPDPRVSTVLFSDNLVFSSKMNLESIFE